jgi:hypothetical protein
MTISVAYSLKISETITLQQKLMQCEENVSLEYNTLSDVTHCSPANILYWYTKKWPLERERK